MKRWYFGFIISMLFFVITTGCVTTRRIYTLEKAISYSSKKIESDLALGTTVVILHFNSEAVPFNNYAISEITQVLVDGKKLKVVDRARLDLIRQEMNFQMSGDVDESQQQQIGRMLGAQSILTGALVKIGDMYRFRVQSLNVESAVVESSASVNVRDSIIDELLRQRSDNPPSPPNGGSSSGGTAPAAPAPSPVSRADGTRQRPYALSLDTPLMGTLTSGAPELWYTLAIPRRGMLKVETTGDTDTYMELYDGSARNLIAEDDDGGSGLNACIDQLLNEGTYLVKVKGYDSSGGSFILKAVLESFQSLPLNIGGSREGRFTSSNDVHWYQLTASSGQIVVYTESNLDTMLYVYNSQGKLIVEDDDSGDGSNARVTFTASQGDTIYIKVKEYDGKTGAYTIRSSR